MVKTTRREWWAVVSLWMCEGTLNRCFFSPIRLTGRSTPPSSRCCCGRHSPEDCSNLLFGFLAAAFQVLLCGLAVLDLRDGLCKGEFVRRRGERVTGGDALKSEWKFQVVLICMTLIVVVGAVVWSGIALAVV